MTDLDIPLEALLTPISDLQPAGIDLYDSDEWVEIKEAKRFDEKFNRGPWETNKPLKVSDWTRVIQLATDALTSRTKDLRLCVFLFEALVHRHGYYALGAGLDFLCSFATRFWDLGIHPEVDERVASLQYLSNEDKFPLQLRTLLLTQRSDGRRDCSFADCELAIAVGYERDVSSDEEKYARWKSLAKNGVTREILDEAVKVTPQAYFGMIRDALVGGLQSLDRLNHFLVARMGDESPSLGLAKEAFETCLHQVEGCIVSRPEQSAQPDPNPKAFVPTQNRPTATVGEMTGDSGAWMEAERMIAEGRVTDGLELLTSLAAAEHGRSRFLRRLRLAEVCLAHNKKRLGASILEDLAQLIDKKNLREWESSETIARVWGRLAHLHGEGDPDRRRALLKDLCELDPWQALKWDEQPS